VVVEGGTSTERLPLLVVLGAAVLMTELEALGLVAQAILLQLLHLKAIMVEMV